MAVLDATNRFRTCAGFLRDKLTGGLGSLTKADVQAAVNAADDWVDSNSAAFNSALPQPFRGAASTQQKALLLAYLALRRAGGAKTLEDG